MLTRSPSRPRSQTGVAPGILGIPINDLLLLLVVLIWGANFSIIKEALPQIPPLTFAALRFDIAAVVLLLLLWQREGRAAFPTGRVFWRLTWMGLLGSALYQIFFTLGLAYTTASNAALIIATSPAMIALLGALFGIETLTRRIGLGIALALAGVALVVGANGVRLSWQTLHGDLLMVAAAGCWAVYTLGVRKLEHGPSPLSITTFTMLVGAIGLTLVSLPELRQMQWETVGVAAWEGLAYASLLGLVVAYFLWNNSVRLVGGNRTAIYSCGIPLVAMLVAWPMLGEQPALLQGLGALLIVAGVLLARRKQ